jgi:hypothetical protein
LSKLDISALASKDQSQTPRELALWILHKSPLDQQLHHRWLRVTKGSITLLRNDKDWVPLFEIPLAMNLSVLDFPTENGTQAIEMVTPTGNHILKLNDPKLSIKELILDHRK